jgi:hypothetical protein
MAAVMLFSGCSAENENPSEAVFEAVADSIASALVEGFVEGTQAGAVFASEVTDADTAISAVVPVQVSLRGISDMILVGSRIYAAHDEGVLIYDLSDKTTTNLVTGEPINAVVQHAGKVYVGGEKLLILNGVDLEPVDLQFEGVINELVSFNLHLIVGTDKGMYSRSVLGDQVMLDEVSVSSIAADESGLWVGTNGQGLYRWDGEDFTRRFLSRDSSLFDYVNCLAFNHAHLYVGTDSGMFIFDGGRWTTLTSEDGLPSDYIKAFDASTWVVYVATDAGITSYFNGDFMPVKKLTDRDVNSIVLLGRKIIVGTEDEGVLMKSGPALKTLVDPNSPTAHRGVDIFSVSP